MTALTALVDADIPAYIVAAKCEDRFDFDGNVAVDLRRHDVKPMIRETIEDILWRTGADRVIVCLSDPTTPGYFRRQMPSLAMWDPVQYKESRTTSAKPALLQHAKNVMHELYPSICIKRLEADDVLGVLHTAFPDETIMVSGDKDMRTVPGTVYDPGRNRTYTQNLLEANQFLLYQVMIGDSTDGYPGCPGIGPKSPYVDDLIEAETTQEMWEVVCTAYASKGLTDLDAIMQARMAYILRDHSYDPVRNRIALWYPEYDLSPSRCRPRQAVRDYFASYINQ